MQQTRLVSLIETCTNTFIGFWLSFAFWPVVGWLLDFEYTTSQHWNITLLFTLLSVARGYVIRRFFNNGLHMFAVNLAKRLKR